MSAIPFLEAIDLNKNELQNAVVQRLATAPGSPATGQVYYNTTDNLVYFWNGAAWIVMSGAGTSGVTQASASGASGRVKISAGADKAIIDYSGAAGILKTTDANGTLAPAVAGTDYLAPSGSGTALTGVEKTANKDATGGYVGMTLFAINFKNVANTFTSFFTNTNTAARTYTFQNRDGTIADDTDITSAKARANHTGTQTASTISDFAAAVIAQLLAGLSTATATVVTASDSILVAIGKLQAQITGYAASTKTLTNTTFDANGTGNTISNIEVADHAAGVIVTSTALAGAANTNIPTTLAVKTYIDAVLGANDAMILKGGIDCSANPNYPAADAGWSYKVTIAGKIGGASGQNVQIGDTLICTVDTSVTGNHATVGANWIILQNNLDVATTTTSGYVSALATNTEAEAKSDTAKVLTPSSLTNFAQKKIFTVGDGAATNYALTHNLGTSDVTVQVRRTSDNAIVQCGAVVTSTNVVTISFGVAPALNTIKAVVIG